jgi:hypothetical protein
LATGGGFATRQLYADTEEVLLNAVRPILLNGIEDMVSRPDLADRAILLTLRPLSEARRRTERELWGSFRQEAPLILGALLDAMVGGLRTLPTTQQARLPRMADFAQWAGACEAELWPRGRFANAYQLNRQHAVDDVVQLDPLANAVRQFMTGQTAWTGTATELVTVLNGRPQPGTARKKAWPDSPRAAAAGLRRAAPFLREVGVDIAFVRTGHMRNRVITLRRTAGAKTSQN